jgi:hypothetical protein
MNEDVDLYDNLIEFCRFLSKTNFCPSDIGLQTIDECNGNDHCKDCWLYAFTQLFGSNWVI